MPGAEKDMGGLDGSNVEATSTSGLLTEPATDRLDVQLLALNLCAGIVALIGLFQNNPTIVIGAMIISPLLSPLYSFAVYSHVGNINLALRNLSVLVVLLLLLIAFSAGMTYFFSLFYTLDLTPEINLRIAHQWVNILMAIVLGVAMILSHTRKFYSSLVGIGVAIALVPPAVTIGICMELYPAGIFESTAQLADNVIGLLAGSFSTLLVMGIFPRRLPENVRGRQINRAIFLALLLCLFFLIWTSVR